MTFKDIDKYVKYDPSEGTITIVDLNESGYSIDPTELTRIINKILSNLSDSDYVYVSDTFDKITRIRFNPDGELRSVNSDKVHMSYDESSLSPFPKSELINHLNKFLKRCIKINGNRWFLKTFTQYTYPEYHPNELYLIDNGSLYFIPSKMNISGLKTDVQSILGFLDSAKVIIETVLSQDDMTIYSDSVSYSGPDPLIQITDKGEVIVDNVRFSWIEYRNSSRSYKPYMIEKFYNVYNSIKDDLT